jgi:ATP-binding cassette subfamily C (CFTR/MRP) protein 1
VDIETDRTMQKIIREDFQNRTIIAVAHRLDTILDFDKIIVLDKGWVIEQGPPNQLLSQNGAFKTLFTAYRSERDSKV